MILNRLGNKRRIAKKIITYFPKHDIYFEPFFGAGGIFFNKPKAKYNYLNDNDAEVYNLFTVVSEKKEEFIELLYRIPECQDLMDYWKKNKETDPVRQAVRFIFLSNFSYLGKGNTITFGPNNTKKLILERLDKTNQMLFGCQLGNRDYKTFFKCFPQRVNKKRTLIYCDPPYLDTKNNYQSGFTQGDTRKLLDILCDYGAKFAMSEFDNPFILNQAEKRGLNVIPIIERRNLKNKRTEILITNYPAQPPTNFQLNKTFN